MIVILKREGRCWTNKATGREEEVLTVSANGIKAQRGICLNYFMRIAGIRFKMQQERHFEFREV